MSTKAKTLFLLNSTAGSLAASEPSGLTAEDIDGYEACCYHDMIEDDVTADIQTIDASPTDQLTSMLDVLVSSLSEAQLKKLGLTYRTYAVKLMAGLVNFSSDELGRVMCEADFNPWHFALDYTIVLHLKNSLVDFPTGREQPSILPRPLLTAWSAKTLVARVHYNKSRVTLKPFDDASETYFQACFRGRDMQSFLNVAFGKRLAYAQAPQINDYNPRVLVSFQHPTTSIFEELNFTMLVFSIVKHPDMKVVKVCFLNALIEHYHDVLLARVARRGIIC